jgi:serine/threonine protein kinase
VAPDTAPAILPGEAGHVAPRFLGTVPAAGEPPGSGAATRAGAPASLPEPPSAPGQGARALPPEPPRPLPPAFWGAGGAALAALLLHWAWKRWARRRTQRFGEPDAALRPMPDRVGPYRITRTLGVGAFATTYLAQGKPGGPEVALKVLHPHYLENHEWRRRFGREARLCAALEHPGLVRLVDPGTGEEPAWIAFEYVSGPTLEAYLREQGQLSPAEAAAIALGIAEALAYVHARGVVHRDLKPANVLLCPAGPRVMDLGIARELDADRQTTLGGFLGTPRYAAPEAQFSAGAGPAADRYSLGAMLYEMLAGRPVFTGETAFAILEQHRSAAIPDIQAVRPVPADLARLLGRLLAKEPEQRPEDGELVAKLRLLAAGGPDA